MGDESSESLRRKILKFAKKHIGKKVGRGDCFDLPNEALNDAQAKSASDYGKITNTADYIWGRPVSLDRVKPGDILQFRKHRATVIKKTKIVFPDKTLLEYEKSRTYVRGHHSAIAIGSVNQGTLKVLEQHVKRGGPAIDKRTGEGTIYVKGRKLPPTKENIKIGKAWAKKVKALSKKKADKEFVDGLVRDFKGKTVKATVEITITVSGVTSAYRAEPK